MDFKQEVEITGIEAVNKALKELPLKMQKNAIRGATFATVKLLAEKIQVEAPLKTGALRASIRASRGREGRGGSRGVFYSYIKGIFYAGFLEKGTKFMPAQAFIMPTAKEESLTLLKEFAHFMEIAIEKQYKKLSKMQSK